MQKISGSSYARKETVDIDIFVTSRNSDRKIMESIRITDSGVTLLLEHSPSRASDINYFKNFSHPRESQLNVTFNLLLFFLVSYC